MHIVGLLTKADLRYILVCCKPSFSSFLTSDLAHARRAVSKLATPRLQLGGMFETNFDPDVTSRRWVFNLGLGDRSRLMGISQQI